jgi:hypothetical protein
MGEAMQTSRPTPTPDDVRWMCGLHELARNWIASQPAASETARTGHYVDLTFAFALAGIGAVEESEEFIRQASGELDCIGDAHRMLFQMYSFRIAQAQLGQPHRGMFPGPILGQLDVVDRLLKYAVNRLRKQSRILEPDQRINPFPGFGDPIDCDREEFTLMTDPDELFSRVHDRLETVAKGKDWDQRRAEVLRAALEAAPRSGEAFARKILEQVVPAYDALAAIKKKLPDLFEPLALLESSLAVSRRFEIADFVRPLMDRVRAQVATSDIESLRAFSATIRECIRLLTVLRLRDELDSFLNESAGLVLRGRPIDQFVGTSHKCRAGLHAMLCIAEGWYRLGRDSLAEPVIGRTWTLLLCGRLHPRDQVEFACSVANTLAKAARSAACRGLEDLLNRLPFIPDGHTTAPYYNFNQLDVVESVALSAIEVCRRS